MRPRERLGEVCADRGRNFLGLRVFLGLVQILGVGVGLMWSPLLLE